MANSVGGNSRLENEVQELVRIVRTGNGEPSLIEKTRRLEGQMETVLDMQNHQTAILEDLKKAKDRQEIAEEIKGQMIAAREKRDKSMQTWLKFGIAIISLLLGWLTYRLESKGKNVSDLVHPEVSQGIHQSIAKD